MTVQFTHQFPVLPVADFIKTQEYYRDVLQFTIDWSDRDQFGCVTNGAISLFFAKSTDFTPGHVLVWNTANADQVYEEYKASGAQIVEDIETRSWGMREFVMQDINGHRMRIGHVDESIADYSQFKRRSDG